MRIAGEKSGKDCPAATTEWWGAGIFILRVGVALMILSHGWPKLQLLMEARGGEWMDPLGWGGAISPGLCVLAEFFCALAMLIGVFTRIAALALVINFWVALFAYGQASSWAVNELPSLYLVCFVTLLCTGAGPFSVDNFLRRWILSRKKLGHGRSDTRDYENLN